MPSNTRSSRLAIMSRLLCFVRIIQNLPSTQKGTAKMPEKIETLRIKSPELMKVIEDTAKKLYVLCRGSFSIDFRIERDILGDTLLLGSFRTLYFLKVRFDVGDLFYRHECVRFEFSAELENDIYRIAQTTIKSWSDEYFREV